MSRFVVAVTATHRRPAELARLLESLEKIKDDLGAVMVVDNAGDAEAVVSKAKCNALRLAPRTNLGCGGGLALGERTAVEMFGKKMTHIWILDDDAVVHPDTLSTMLDALEHEHADIACPMIANEHGRIAWFPGLLDAKKFRTIREPLTPPEFITICGDAAIPFSWATGISLVVTRRAMEKQGGHREDFWVRGEDLEFSLRHTAHQKGIFVPHATVVHLPPPADQPASRGEEYLKHCAMLQNLCYLAFRLPHGRRIARTLPGNYLRFLKTWWHTLAIARDAPLAFWLGAVRGKPAGIPGFDHFRVRGRK